MPSIDERLMAAAGADQQGQKEMGYEDELRQKKLAGEDKERQADGEPSSAEAMEDKLGSLRERWRAAKRAMDLKQKAKDKLEEKVAAPAKLGTNWLLRVAWGLMMGFITFIPGVLLADLHVFGRMTLGKKFFCDLGDEWPGSKMVNAMGPAKLIKSLGEKMGLAMANVILLFVVIGIFALLSWFNDNLIFQVYDKITGAGEWVFNGGN